MTRESRSGRSGSDPVLEGIQALMDGNVTVRLQGTERGVSAETAAAFNALARRHQTMNEDLQRFQRLSEQIRQAEYKNREVEQARAALEEKAEQLALSSRYKSEFLANMSHELRTPLNSLLVLAQLLAQNGSNNLTAKQIEYAQAIYASGNDLLALINDILDLAKVESGTVSINIETERFSTLRDYVERTFRQIALDKALEFTVRLDPQLPPALQTDPKRLQQILKNLLSNAFKFTARGSVLLDVTLAPAGWTRGLASLEQAEKVVAFSVTDTGIGIPADKQRIIFEAFQQADGTTSREFGGTGLGLSISSELARLLGGEIQVSSAPGQGSTFTLFVPLLQAGGAHLRADARRSKQRAAETLVESRAKPAASSTALLADAGDRPDDIRDIGAGDRVALIIAGDRAFADRLLATVRTSGFRGVNALNGLIGAALAREIAPDVILLDARLPDIDAWGLLESFRQDRDVSRVPVNLLSFQEGACWTLSPVRLPEDTALAAVVQEARKLLASEASGRVLVVAGSPAERAHCLSHLAACGQVEAVSSATDALEALAGKPFDCLVIGATLADPSNAVLRGVAQRAPDMALVRILEDTPRHEAFFLRRLPSPEVLLDAAARSLRDLRSDLPARSRARKRILEGSMPGLAGRKILIVDDDIRNIFALTSALERENVIVVHAENGLDGMEALNRHPDIALILMDLMMPELDGYDTIRLIRGQKRFEDIPIIGVTARAMKGDRDKCLEAGASDYIAKPVNVQHLLFLMRVWLALDAEQSASGTENDSRSSEGTREWL